LDAGYVVCVNGFSTECLLLADSVEKVGFSNWKISKLIISSEPVHHVAWLWGYALIVAAWLIG